MNLIKNTVLCEPVTPRGWTIVRQAFDIGTAERIGAKDGINVIRQFLGDAPLLGQRQICKTLAELGRLSDFEKS